MQALTIWGRPPLLTTGGVCLGSPPKQITLPPNNCLHFIISWSDLSKASILYQWKENTSSRMISLDILISLANELCALIEQVESSNIWIRILNLEWAVLPPSRFWAASPVLATQSTIPPSDLIFAVITFRTNVFPYHPGEFKMWIFSHSDSFEAWTAE